MKFISDSTRRLMSPLHAAGALAAAILCLPALAEQPAADNLPDPSVEAQLKAFQIPEGFQINLFAGDPDVKNPVHMNWDARGRLWIACSTLYPHIKPGEKANDYVVILEDKDGDGVAETKTVFAEGLHIPTAVLPVPGGCLVANSTEILFLEDKDGDDRADTRKVLLSGFGTEDTHHLIHAFNHGPDGWFYFLQSIYIHTHLETPHGVKRLAGGGVWMFQPKTWRMEILSKGLINPWGFEFDQWGQSFATDGAGGEGINFIFPGSVFATSPGAKRILRGLSPGQPKHCGLEIIESTHFPDSWQGTFVTNDFRGNRVNRFSLSDEGSGYRARQEADVLASTHPAFRPVCVKTGPDGALYILDWYNPIIQHGEVDFRDPRRDHEHGRVWRLTSTERPALPKPALAGKSTSALVEELESPNRWNRHFAKRLLSETEATEILPALEAWKNAAPDSARRQIESLWAAQSAQASVPAAWVDQLLAHTDPNIRAAGLRYLWTEPEGALKRNSVVRQLAGDQNARVRLWAVCVLAKLGTPEDFAAATQAVTLPVDDNIDFALEQFAETTRDAWLPPLKEGKLDLGTEDARTVYALRMANDTSSLEKLIGMLPALPQDQRAGILATAGEKAGAEEINAIFKAALASEEFAAQALPALTAAAARGVIPAEVEKSAEWLNSGHEPLAKAAFDFSAKTPALAPTLQTIARTEADTPLPRRMRAAKALSMLDAASATALAGELGAEIRPEADIFVAAAALAGPDAPAAARLTARILEHHESPDSVLLFDLFFTDKDRAAALSNELKDKKIASASAVIGLRKANEAGLLAETRDALQKAGGIAPMEQQLTPEALAALVKDVREKGDAARGEDIYRRPELLCVTCHAIGGAGGLVGPDLMSIGASAPVDYLIESLLEPGKQIKEGYHTTMLTENSGLMHAGMITKESDTSLFLRDAAGMEKEIKKSELKTKQIVPVSLMPPGLTMNLRPDEFVDLTRFLAELGKEGSYKTVQDGHIRSWKVIQPNPKLDDRIAFNGAPDLLKVDAETIWTPVTSRVSGKLALSDLPLIKHRGQAGHFVRFQVKAAADREATLQFPNPKGLNLWHNGQPVSVESELKLPVKAGDNEFLLRVDPGVRGGEDLEVLAH